MKIEQSCGSSIADLPRPCSDSDIGRISEVVLRLCLARGLPRPQAEDVVQEVWVWLLRAGLPPHARSPAWIAAVAANFVLRWRRASAVRRRREVSGLDRVEEPLSHPDFSGLEADEILDRVARVLPETERKLLLLIRQGHSLARAAAILKIPRGSRSYHHHRLLEFARRELDRPGPPLLAVPENGPSRPPDARDRGGSFFSPRPTRGSGRAPAPPALPPRRTAPTQGRGS